MRQNWYGCSNRADTDTTSRHDSSSRWLPNGDASITTVQIVAYNDSPGCASRATTSCLQGAPPSGPSAAVHAHHGALAIASACLRAHGRPRQSADGASGAQGGYQDAPEDVLEASVEALLVVARGREELVLLPRLHACENEGVVTAQGRPREHVAQPRGNKQTG